MRMQNLNFVALPVPEIIGGTRSSGQDSSCQKLRNCLDLLNAEKIVASFFPDTVYLPVVSHIHNY